MECKKCKGTFREEEMFSCLNKGRTTYECVDVKGCMKRQDTNYRSGNINSQGIESMYGIPVKRLEFHGWTPLGEGCWRDPVSGTKFMRVGYEDSWRPV